MSDSDIAMDASESPFKSPAKSAALAQPKPTLPSFGGASAPFSFKPTNTDTSQDQKAQSSQLFGSFFRPKQSAAEQQAPTLATNSFQPPKPTDKETCQEQPSQPSAPVFNLFPKSAEPDKDTAERSSAQFSLQPFNPFAALKPAEKENTQEGKPADPFSFGASSGTAPKANQDNSSEQKAQDAGVFHPFQSLQSGDEVNALSQPQRLDSGPKSSQPSHANGSIRFSTFETSKTVDSQQTQPSAPFNPFQPLKSSSAESSQTPSGSKTFQSMTSADTHKPEEAPPHSSGRSDSLFQTFKPSTEGASTAIQSPAKLAPNNLSDDSDNVDAASQQGKAESSSKQIFFTPTATSVSGHPQSTKNSETPLKLKSTDSGNVFGNGIEQSKPAGTETTKRTPSETSTLFARSLGQSSTTAIKPAGVSTPSQSQTEQRANSPTKPGAAPQKTVGEVSTTNTPSASATEPFMVKVKSHGASNVPQELNNDDFADFDKSYRLHSLNARFKKQIAELDPAKHDFEPIIRFYATQRAAIGYPLGGLYHRVKAGEKRKTEEADRVEAAPNAVKRTKLDTPATSFHQQADRPVFGFSAITSVSTTPQPATAGSPQKGADRPSMNFNSTTNDSTSSQLATATSNTSNVFKSMLPSSNQSSFGTQAGLPPTSSPSKSGSAVSTPKPTEQQAPPSAPSTFSPMNSKTSTFQMDTKSSNNTSAHSATTGAHKTSQLFQPKPAAASTLEPPKFASAGGTDFMAAFAAQAKKNAAKMEAENKAKRKAEEFDSDEDDEAEYERKVAEEDRAKRAKIEAIARAGSGFTPVLSSASSMNGASPAAEQDEDSTRDASGEGTDRDEEDSESQEGQNDGEADEDQDDEGQEDEESNEDDDIQTAMAKSHARPKNSFNSSSDPNSLFNRITKPDSPSEDKGSKNDAASPPEQANSSVLSAPLGSGLFGSRPNTPNHDSPKPFGTSIFSNAGSSTPTGDNTWKPGSAIKFGAPSSAPAVNITPATPLSKTNGDTTQSPFSTFSAVASKGFKPDATTNDDAPKASSSLFGASSFAPQSTTGSSADTVKPFSNLFGDASKKTIVNQSSAGQVGFSFGGPGTSLLTPSNVSSAMTSRATSPGITDNESAAESGTDDQVKDPQSDYMTSRPGEENENVLFEVRSKVLEYMTDNELNAIGSKEEAGWKTRGLGPLRLLEHRETGRRRIVMRSEPGANVVINSPLIEDNKYDVNSSGKEGASIKTGIYKDGKLKNWVFKVKTMKIAYELVDCLKENEPGNNEEEEA